MNKKVLVSLAAVATLSFASFGVNSADASTINKCNSTNYNQYKVVKQFSNSCNKNFGSVIVIGGTTIKPGSNNSTGTEQSTPNVEQPEIVVPETNGSTTEQPEVNVPNTENNEQVSDDTSVSAFEQEVLTLTNAERAKQGLPALTLDEELSKVARIKSQDMKDNNYFSHTSPTYGSPFEMMKQFGISYSSAAENIAQGQTTPEEVVKAWMNSQGHRENILNANYTHIGIGYVEDGNYWTQMFIGK